MSILNQPNSKPAFEPDSNLQPNYKNYDGFMFRPTNLHLTPKSKKKILQNKNIKPER